MNQSQARLSFIKAYKDENENEFGYELDACESQEPPVYIFR